MKARIATVLSLTGVLVAGAAAAVVNAQVLRASEQSVASDTMISLVLDSRVSSVPSTTVAGLPTQSSAPVAPARPMYQVGDAALITLDTSDGVLSVVSAVPNRGWTVLAASSLDATNIEVLLQTGASVVAFRANLLLGAVTTAVEVSSAAPATTVPGSSSVPTTAPSTAGSTSPSTAPSTAGPANTANSTSVIAVPIVSSSPSTTDDDSDDGGGEEEEDD